MQPASTAQRRPDTEEKREIVRGKFELYRTQTLAVGVSQVHEFLLTHLINSRYKNVPFSITTAFFEENSNYLHQLQWFLAKLLGHLLKCIGGDRLGALVQEGVPGLCGLGQARVDGHAAEEGHAGVLGERLAAATARRKEGSSTLKGRKRLEIIPGENVCALLAMWTYEDAHVLDNPKDLKP
jgi:hypothetical protein